MSNSGVGLAAWVLFLLGYFGYYMPYKNSIEGARLESLYGDTYRRYAVAVPRLIPRLRAYGPLGTQASDRREWQRPWGGALSSAARTLQAI